MVRFLFLFILSLISVNSYGQSLSEIKTIRYFEAIKSHPHKLHAFLYKLPKGGDLHNHAGGAVFAENLLHYARHDRLCVDRKTYTVFHQAFCPYHNQLNVRLANPVFHRSLVDAWSMRHFNAKNESGHDHFFSAFQKYGTIYDDHTAQVLAEIASRAAEQNELYIELMISLDNKQPDKLGSQVGWDDNLKHMREKLFAAGIKNITQLVSKNIDSNESMMRDVLGCSSKHPQRGCGMVIRYLYQVRRNLAPEIVFAQMLSGFEAASHDKRIVGINMVQAEDNPIATRDYHLHMQMLDFLHKLYPQVNISLHAGELTAALVPNDALSFHIHDAVYVGQAKRIGHGVDIMQEHHAHELLNKMARDNILVEINLSSNANILGIMGQNHPIRQYLQYDVPIAISTDDEGITRHILTDEYQLAVDNYKLSYSVLKNIIRNSLAYSFLAGKTLWMDKAYHYIHVACARDVLGSDNPSAHCMDFLNANEKASMQWELEKRFNKFESHYK